MTSVKIKVGAQYTTHEPTLSHEGANSVAAIFAGTCPNCNGPISSLRLEKALPCNECLPSASAFKDFDSDYDRIAKVKELLEPGRAGVYTYLYDVLNELGEFDSFFRKSMGRSFWDLQRTWALRLIMGESFAITAPTGVGKTTLLLHYAVFTALKSKKVYILVPTETLLLQTQKKLENIIEKHGARIRLVVYNSRLTKPRREHTLSRIIEGDFDILVTTTGFLSRRFETVSRHRFDLILVDDADSLLKNSKNIDRILVLLGFSEDDVSNAYKIIKAKRDLFFYKASGKLDKVEEKQLEIEQLTLLIEEAKASKKIGQLAIASATGRQAGIKPKLFRELLSFEVGGIHDYMRNIIEAYKIVDDDKLPKLLVGLVKDLGNGGLIFVSKDRGKVYAKFLVEYLRRNGIRAELATTGKKPVRKLEEGEADVLVGVASYYGVIVRGVDLPNVIKYAIFVGIPKQRILLEKALQSPRRLLQVYTYLETEGKLDPGDDWIGSLMKKLEKLSYGEHLALRIALANNSISKLEGRLYEIGKMYEKAIDVIVKRVSDIARQPGDKIDLGTGYVERSHDDSMFFVTPDVMTYIQASGRTSRFLNDRMTLGLSIIIENDLLPVRAMEKKISSYVSKFAPLELDDINLDEVKEKLKKSRTSGEGSKSFKPARAIMIIVESPNKARTIAKYFGRPSRRRMPGAVVYEIPIVDPVTLDTYLALIVATKGHVYDLVVDDNVGIHGVLVKKGTIIPVFSHIKRCLGCGHVFSSVNDKCPRCGETIRIKSAKDVMQSLRRLAFEVQEIVIATDPDVEGEKIAWDVYLSLKPFNTRIRRIEFNEVTKNAILEALRSPRNLSYHRVMAQLARRVSDRWIGFTLSKHLWIRFNKNWLGAGRVQTPVLGWILDNYEKWKATRGYWILVYPKNLPLLKVFAKDKKDADQLFESIQKESSIYVTDSIEHEEELSPSPPFTTDQILVTSNRLLGYSTNLTMKLLQDLFEAGLITYHRTDSTRVSSKGVAVARQYIHGKLGKPEYFIPRSWGNTGAHEAIRPVMPLDSEELRKSIADGSLRTGFNLTELHIRLYDLIFRRFIASQMRPSKILKCKTTIKFATREHVIEYATSIVVEGHVLMWPVKLYQCIRPGERVEVHRIRIVRGSFNPLYTQGDVISLMKDRGLGRPSTYAKILENIRRHGYTIYSKKRKYVIPTKLGKEVYSYLHANFPGLINEKRTAMLERQMDLIEQGSLSHVNVLFRLLDELKGYELVKPFDGLGQEQSESTEPLEL